MKIERANDERPRRIDAGAVAPSSVESPFGALVAARRTACVKRRLTGNRFERTGTALCLWRATMIGALSWRDLFHQRRIWFVLVGGLADFELFWYVQPEHRGGTGRMSKTPLREFAKKACGRFNDFCMPASPIRQRKAFKKYDYLAEGTPCSKAR